VYLAINMVATLDGRTAVNGTAIGIGSATDKRLMYELRSEADVVLHGAGTVRADPLSARVPDDLVSARLQAGLPRQPLGAIVTASGRLPIQHPYYRSATRVYVTTSAPASVEGGPNVEVCHVSDVAAAVHDLHARGARKVLCEGGPTLNAALFAAGLVDEVFLTLAPKIVGGEAPLTLVHGAVLPEQVRLQLVNMVQLDDELYLRYAVRRA
jgi:riboflavin-specific deaminase-like protein